MRSRYGLAGGDVWVDGFVRVCHLPPRVAADRSRILVHHADRDACGIRHKPPRQLVALAKRNQGKNVTRLYPKLFRANPRLS